MLFSASDKALPSIYGITQGRDMSSIVGAIPILFAIYVFTKYFLTTPFSMIGESVVATPSVSKSREPAFPAVRAKSMIVSPSGNTLVSRDSFRNDIFCCIEDAFNAVKRGDTRRDAALQSTTILYLPPRRLFGAICLTAFSRAILLHSLRLRSINLGVASHQKPLYLFPAVSSIVISQNVLNDVSVCLPSKPWESQT